jgi:hypothetical protein
MQLRIDAVDLPGSGCGPSPTAPGGYTDIRVGVQRRNDQHDILGLTRASERTVTWTLDCTAGTTASGAPDLTGAHVCGTPGKRFIYLSWLSANGEGPLGMFRRAKIALDAVPPDVLAKAVKSGTLVGRVGLTDHKGNPRCAAIVPPVIEWTAE